MIIGLALEKSAFLSLQSNPFFPSQIIAAISSHSIVELDEMKILSSVVVKHMS